MMQGSRAVPLFYALLQLVYASDVHYLRGNALQHRDKQDKNVKAANNSENTTIIIGQAGAATVHVTVTITTTPLSSPRGTGNMPTVPGTGAAGIAQPPSMAVPKINSATLALDPLIGGGSANQTSGNLGASSTVVNGGGDTGSATTAGLKIAGILLSSQPPSAATIGIPQPPAPVEAQAVVNSATLATARIVGGTGGVAAATGGTSAASSTGQGVPGAANALNFARFLNGGGFLGSILVLLL